MKTESEKITVPRFLNMFEKFSPSEKLKIAEQINQKTFAERWSALDAELPDVEMSEEEITNEVRTVRYGKGSARGANNHVLQRVVRVDEMN